MTDGLNEQEHHAEIVGGSSISTAEGVADATGELFGIVAEGLRISKTGLLGKPSVFGKAIGQ